MNPKRINKFQCYECSSLYDRKDAALSCCGEEELVIPVTVMVCTECGDEHYDEDDARLCCRDGETVLPPTPAELEAAGQQRLAL